MLKPSTTIRMDLDIKLRLDRIKPKFMSYSRTIDILVKTFDKDAEFFSPGFYYSEYEKRAVNYVEQFLEKNDFKVRVYRRSEIDPRTKDGNNAYNERAANIMKDINDNAREHGVGMAITGNTGPWADEECYYFLATVERFGHE